jgi:hypothetical protein
MKNENFEKELIIIQQHFPNLKIVELGDERYLSGPIEIIDVDGQKWDEYDIELKASEDFPLRFPKLFETGNSFPKNMDWHVYPEDGSCCVDIPHNEIIICNNGLTVLEYIQRHAIPYFANQTFRKREGYYLYGEYSHGLLGKMEFYQSKLKTKSLKQLIEMLIIIVKGFNSDRTASCPVCTTSKFRKCHRDTFLELEKIKWNINYDLINQLIPLYKELPNFNLQNE